MSEDIFKILLDKGLLASVILVTGYWLNGRLEVNKQNVSLKNKIKESNRDRTISLVERQLANFYFPIYFRLQRDNAIWKLSPQLSGQDSTLPFETNDLIENDFILKNHLEILQIIENNIQYVEVDDELQEAINRYVHHITVYEIIRKTASLKKHNPIDFNAPYPQELESIIKVKMDQLKDKNNALLSGD